MRRTRSAYRRAAELERATRATAPDRQAVAVTMPISDNVNDPEYWRKCAEDARTKAEETLDPKSKERLLRNAKEYDWLANLAESGDRSPAGASTPSASARDKQVMLSGAMGADHHRSNPPIGQDTLWSLRRTRRHGVRRDGACCRVSEKSARRFRREPRLIYHVAEKHLSSPAARDHCCGVRPTIPSGEPRPEPQPRRGYFFV